MPILLRPRASVSLLGRLYDENLSSHFPGVPSSSRAFSAKNRSYLRTLASWGLKSRKCCSRSSDRLVESWIENLNFLATGPSSHFGILSILCSPHLVIKIRISILHMAVVIELDVVHLLSRKQSSSQGGVNRIQTDMMMDRLDIEGMNESLTYQKDIFVAIFFHIDLIKGDWPGSATSSARAA